MKHPIRTLTAPPQVVAFALACSVGCAPHAFAADAAEAYSLHGQFTNVTQWQQPFRSPYQGDNSLTPQRSSKATNDITLFVSARLWRGGEVDLNPEIDQGYGLSNTLGAAGFPSGEAYKVGANAPYIRLPRAFVRQVVGLGDETEAVASGANALAGTVARDRLTLTLGKFSVGDVFDANGYAHDPRADFLNWSIIESGAFDYAADAWGYTHGASADLRSGDWSLRLGLFALSETPNSTRIDKGFGQRAWIAEVEHRHEWFGGAGTLRALAYVNRGRMARYDDAVAAVAAGAAPEVAPVRRLASKSGWALNAEQELAPSVGAFVRLSGSDGSKEAFDFTEINRSLAGGVVVGGARWGRPADAWGTGFAVNAISDAARRYFAAGGNGILIGDGALPNVGRERIVETWYRAGFAAHYAVSVDIQRITNPAYNRDRGPVNMASLRLHAEF